MNSRLCFKEGAIGGLLGVSGGAAGSGFGGPTANPSDPTGNANLANSYNQLQQVAQGNGPNPAMAQYNQNVQNLAKQQSGAISSVQGISPALAARMASQQGSGAMQNAAAQGATMQAQQQLGAMGQAAGVAGSQANIAAGMQQNVNNVNGSLAQNQMQGQQGLMGGIMSGFGAMSGAGGMAAAAANGGMAGKDFGRPMADGGDVSQPSLLSQFLSGQNPQSVQTQVAPTQSLPAVSGFDKGLGGYGAPKGKSSPGGGATSSPSDTAIGDYAPGGTDIYQSPNFGASLMNMHGGMGASDYMGSNSDYATSLMNQPTGMAKGGQVSALLSPGETYIPPGKVKQAAKSANPLASGKKVPGKPRVAGNSYANDVVPAKLDAGGVVIPNSIMQSKDPAAGAKDFIAGIIAKRKARK